MKFKNNFKADLSLQNAKDDNLYHPKGESVLNRPKIALNQKVEVKLSGNKDEFNKTLKISVLVEEIRHFFQKPYNYTKTHFSLLISVMFMQIWGIINY